MEEEKAAAYYDELSRKGEGAARFKQGLGFSSASASIPARGSSSSFLNQFVKADEKESEIRSIRDKLTKKNKPEDRVTESRENELRCRERRRSRSRDRDGRDRGYRRRSRSVERRRRRRRSRSWSPRRREEQVKDKKIDYSRLITGYDHMSAAEKVKAKMKLQLHQTAVKDTTKGAGWERFEFDKDAPVDDEEVEEGTDDDAALVKRSGQSFRFSAIEAKREEQLKAAHDEAMFGVPTRQTPTSSTGSDVATTTSVKDNERENNSGATNLFGEKVLAKQQGSWRDRARTS